MQGAVYIYSNQRNQVPNFWYHRIKTVGESKQKIKPQNDDIFVTSSNTEVTYIKEVNKFYCVCGVDCKIYQRIIKAEKIYD